MNLAIIGASGAGKGTHAASLSARFGLLHVATGDLFRDNVHSRTALGILARKYMEHAELVPDEVVDAMMEEWCDRLPPARGTLFDGFPRTAYQARFLDGELKQLKRELDAVIYLEVPDDEIVARLSGRFICRSCQQPYHQLLMPPQIYGVCDECGGELYHRPDDSTELVRARLRIFHRTTNSVLEHYAVAGKLAIVSGEGAIADVDARLLAAVEAIRDHTYVFATPAEVTALIRRPEARTTTPSRPTLDLVLLGGPGSGKGTQAEVLCRELNLPHIATGDLFRDNLRLATDLGKLAKAYMDRGELVPDDVTEAMVEERLGRPDVHHGFILDGFPRTLPQAHALTEMLNRLHRHLTGVLYIKVSDEAIIDRLSGRMICRNCQASYHKRYKPPQKEGVCDSCGRELYQRADDNPVTVSARLATFHGQTEPLIAFYRHAKLIHEVSGEGGVKDISARCFATIRELQPPVEPSPESSPSARMEANYV